jgi:hypothetical protein
MNSINETTIATAMITETAATTNTKIATSVTTAMTGTVSNGRKSAATETTDEPRSYYLSGVIKTAEGLPRCCRERISRPYVQLPGSSWQPASRFFSARRASLRTFASRFRLISSSVSITSGGTSRGLPFSPRATKVR